MKDEIDKETVGDTLTDKIHKHFCGGYNLIRGDWFDQCMVDYDNIGILKDYAWYSS